MVKSALAQRYPERPDLKFTRLGKPHPDMFEEAIRRCGTRNIVMIGDTPGHRHPGANGVDIASVLVETGVGTCVGTGDPSSLERSDRPVYRMKSLAI